MIRRSVYRMPMPSSLFSLSLTASGPENGIVVPASSGEEKNVRAVEKGITFYSFLPRRREGEEKRSSKKYDERGFGGEKAERTSLFSTERPKRKRGTGGKNRGPNRKPLLLFSSCSYSVMSRKEEM